MKIKKKKIKENYKKKSKTYIMKAKLRKQKKISNSLKQGALNAKRRGHVYEGERLTNYNKFKPPPPLYRSYKKRSRKRNPYNY